MRSATSRSSRETESIWTSSSRRFLMRSWLIIASLLGRKVSLSAGLPPTCNLTAWGERQSYYTCPRPRHGRGASRADLFERALQLVTLSVQWLFVRFAPPIRVPAEADADA